MKLIMLGAPGAGKGTQASVLSEKYSVPHISTGDILRMNIKNQTDLGKTAKQFIDKGLLVPDEIVVGIVMDRIKQDDCKDGFILDGFPRTIPQAEALDKALESEDTNMDFVVNVDVPDEVIVRRLSERRVCPVCGEPYHTKYKIPKVENVCDKCGNELIKRKDDEEETIKKRLVVYHEQTQPLIDYYRNKNILIEVDGTQDVAKVSEEVVKTIGERI